MTQYYLHTVELPKETITSVLRVGDDGIVWTLADGQNDVEYLAWVAEGNTAEEWTGN
jgi:hypothetical protein